MYVHANSDMVFQEESYPEMKLMSVSGPVSLHSIHTFNSIYHSF